MQALLSKYGPEKLYQVTSNIRGSGTLDLTLLQGQVVALLQNKDTKGNSSRWLVDTGGTWDFVALPLPLRKPPSKSQWGDRGGLVGQSLAVNIQTGNEHRSKCRAWGTGGLMWCVKC